MIKGEENSLKGTVILGDNSYFSEDNLQLADEKEMEAVIPDEQFRNRDTELKNGNRREGKEQFDKRYFKHDEKGECYICPRGKKLVFKGKVKLKRNEGYKYQSKRLRRMSIC